MHAEVLAVEMEDEVRRYRESLDRAGATVPIHLVGDHSKISVRVSGLLRVVDALLSGVFSRWDVHYICDALSLSDADFASERLRELLEGLANPEIRSEELSEQEARSMRDELVSLGDK